MPEKECCRVEFSIVGKGRSHCERTLKQNFREILVMSMSEALRWECTWYVGKWKIAQFDLGKNSRG